MKIVKQTPQKLTLKRYPWLIWMMGSVFTIGSLILILSISSQTLACDRTTQRCDLKRSTVLGSTSDSFALSSLEEASVDIFYDVDGDAYRVILRTSEGTLPLTSDYRSRQSGVDQQVQAINTFIANPNQASLRVRQSNWIGPLIGSLVGLVGSGMTVCLGQIVTCDFDKQARQFTFRRQGLSGTQTTEHPLHLVQSCMVEQRNGGDDGNTYRVSLMLKSGEIIPLTPYYSSNYKYHAATQTAIQSFLRLPTHSASPSAASRPSSTALPKTQSSPPTNGQTSPVEGNNVLEALAIDPKIFKDILVGGAEKREAAIADYRRQIVLQPDNTTLYLHLAFVLQMQKQKKEAMLVLESARNRFLQNGDYARAHQIAQAMQSLGLTAESRQ